MIRALPEDSRYVALRVPDVDVLEEDIEMTVAETRALDAKVWTFDRRLLAMVTNAVNANTVLTGGPWKDDRPPEFDMAGPIDWDPKRKRKLDAKEKVETGNWSNWDIAKKLGIIDAVPYSSPPPTD